MAQSTTRALLVLCLMLVVAPVQAERTEGDNAEAALETPTLNPPVSLVHGSLSVTFGLR
ncbi:MAG: hypothetical protein GY906_31255 [bacterium]|nr:hypothetical protein [bacterium]